MTNLSLQDRVIWNGKTTDKHHICGKSDIFIQLNYAGWDGDMMSIHLMGLSPNPFVSDNGSERPKMAWVLEMSFVVM